MSKYILQMILFFVGSIVALPAKALKPEAVLKNDKALELIYSGQYTSAKAELLEAISIEPFDPGLRINLAFAYLANEELAKATKEFEAALKLSPDDKDMQFYSYYNLGFINQLKGNFDLDKAIYYYQQALNRHPESRETKMNIEMLWQMAQGKGKGEGGESDPDSKDGDEGKQPDPNQPVQNGKKQERKFKSGELTKNDVRKILEELKRQEQKIRAEEYKKQTKERPNDKDW